MRPESAAEGPEPSVSLGDVEPPFGRLARTPEHLTRPARVAPEGLLEAAGALVGSYSLEDRTVFVFEHITVEVFRGAGLYAFQWPMSTP